MFSLQKNINSIRAIIIFIGLFSLFSLNSCNHGVDLPANTPSICFQTQVLSIFQTNCGMSGCHSGSGRRSSLMDYNSIMKKITPNDALNSLAFQRIIASGFNKIMPPSPHPPLSSAQITTIEVWIQQGAVNDTTCK